MNILIIGGNGFIGTHLADTLLSHNHKVRILDVEKEKFREPNKAIDYRISSLFNSFDLYESMMGIDVVFHLASTTVPSTSGINYSVDVQNNVISTINIIDCAIRQKIRKLVYFSSGGAIYGIPESLPIKEEDPKKPISSYGIIKYTNEMYVELLCRQNNLDYLIVRPSNPYGPRQGHFIAQGVISTFLRQSIGNDPFNVFGDGNGKKDYIYIQDLVDAILGLLDRDALGIYNIGSGCGYSVNEIIGVIDRVTGKKNEVVRTPGKKYDVQNYLLDTAKVEATLGRQIARTPLETGIRMTYDWLVAQYGK